MANVNMANREVCNLLFVDYKTKKPYLYADYANVSTTGLTGESVYAYGGWGHPKRITFYGERGGTIGFETQITPFKLYSLMTGAEVQSSGNWLNREEVRATENGTLTISDTNATQLNLFIAQDDCGDELDATVENGTVTCDEIISGVKYVAYTMQALDNVQKISITSTTFPGYFTAYMETKDKTEDGDDVLFRMVAYKCAPQTDMQLEFSNTGDPATLTVTCDLMENEDNNILDMLLITDEEEEADDEPDSDNDGDGDGDNGGDTGDDGGDTGDDGDGNGGNTDSGGDDGNDGNGDNNPDETSAVVSSYAELAEALADPEITDIELGDNIESDETHIVELSDGTERNLELAGYSITSTAEQGNVFAVYVSDGSKLNIFDSEGEGSINSGSTDVNTTIGALSGSEVNIYGGSYIGGTEDGTNSDVLYADNARITVYDGQFENIAWTGDIDDVYKVLDIEDNTGAYITCYGGTFVGQNPEYGDDKDTVTGSTFVADGYTVEESYEDGKVVYSVIEANEETP